jgi:hypothetical protein
VVTYDFEPETFDRVIPIELFKDMKNYQLLLAKVAKVAEAAREALHLYLCT